MTPKEKANELVDKFYQRFPLKMNVITTRGDLSWEYDNWEEAKQCALITANECLHTCVESMIYYWNEVKQEINKL
jgi:hypothetical protein